MGKLFRKISVFLVLSCAVFLIFNIVPFLRFSFTNGNTFSNLFIMPSGQNFDLLILGNSHGRFLSAWGNHEKLESVLQKKIFNLAKNGNSIRPERLYFEYFLQKKNKAKTILYFVDSWQVAKTQWEDGNIFFDEPFLPAFYALAYRVGFKSEVLINYWKTKVSLGWLRTVPTPIEGNLKALATLPSPEEKNKAIQHIYSFGYDPVLREDFKNQAELLAIQAIQNNMRLIFILPPQLLRELPTKNEMISVLQELKNKKLIDFADHSNIIAEPKFFSDLYHLNTSGVIFYGEKFIKPLLEKMNPAN